MSPRWAQVCQECWERINPTEYWPDRMDHGTCSICGESRLIVNVDPSTIPTCDAIYTMSTLGGQDVCARPLGHNGRHDWRK